VAETEMALLCALSTCPHGDLSVQMWGPERDDPLSTCRPFAVEIHVPAPELLSGWAPAPTAGYRDIHAPSGPGPGKMMLASPPSAGKEQAR
jgi:uncharacterized protein